MARAVRHVKLRGSVFYYERRVPQAVIDKPGEYNAYFGGQKLFRQSLRTKNQTEALARAKEVEEKFLDRVASALKQAPRAVAEVRLRPVTAIRIEQIKSIYRDMTSEPFRKAAILRENGDDVFVDELDRLISDFELDAERIKGILVLGKPTTDPKLDVADMADSLIRLDSLDAPPGSDARMALQRAIRDGLLAGYRDVTDMMDGRQSWIPSSKLTSKISSPLLADVVASHANHLKPRSRTELLGAYRQFEEQFGRLTLSELTKAHFRQFCSDQGARRVDFR